MKKVTINLCAFVLLCILAQPLYAQSGSPQDPFMMQMIQGKTCGLANGKDASERQCCATDFNTLFQNQQKGVAAIIPGGLQGIFVGFISAIVPGFQQIPVLKYLARPCYDGYPKGEGTACTCENTVKEAISADIEKLCTGNIVVAPNAPPELKKRAQDDYNACIKCAQDEHGFYSGLGCIPGDLADFISNFVLRIGIGIAGFVSLMCIIYSSFLLQVSRGQPEMIQKAREQITSCIIGLLMIIFSIFILRLIGVDILRIPGFA